MGIGQNLIDMVKEYLTPEVMQKISSQAGETPENTKRAIDGIVPTLLYGTATLAESPGGDNQLMKLVEQQAGQGNILDNLVGKLSGGSATASVMSSGHGIAKGLFGDKLGSVVDTIAKSLGIKSGAISSLLSIVAPVVFGVLGKEASARGVGVGGLASLLAGQKSSISQMVPGGLGSLLGWGDIGSKAEPSFEAIRNTYETTKQRHSNRWMFPVLGLAIFGFLAYYFWPQPTVVREETIAQQEVQATPADESMPAIEEAKPLGEAEEVTPAIWQVQQSLKDRGYDPGAIDGIMGPHTERALRQFQEASGLEQSGVIDEATKLKLGYEQ
jgi:OmpA-OmpF porin, OOP family